MTLVIRQYARSWFSAYDKRGKFLAMGRTKGEARTKALAAATGTAKTPKAVEAESSQSGPKGNAHEQ